MANLVMMMGGGDIGMAIEAVVAVLLAVTIGYCAVLNRRLTRLRADEAALKTTIVELINATAMAERAITGLKATVGDCERELGDRLGTAERVAATMAAETRSAEGLLARLARVTEATRRGMAALDPAPAPSAPEPTEGVAGLRAAAMRAEALAARARQRAQGLHGAAA